MGVEGRGHGAKRRERGEVKSVGCEWCFSLHALRRMPFAPHHPLVYANIDPIMNFELHIDELVLHGFAPGDRYHIGAAVEQELAQLFTEQGVPAFLTQSNAIERIDGGAFKMMPGEKAGVVGAQVAQQVYGGLRR